MKSGEKSNRRRGREVVLCAIVGCTNPAPPPHTRGGIRYYRGVCDWCIAKIQKKHGIK